MTQKPQRPWRMVAPLAAVVIIFILWSGYWFAAEGLARNYAESYRGQLAARGFTLTCASESWGGYPFRFEFACSRPVADLPGGRRIGSGNLLAVAQAYDPLHIVGLIDGPTSVTLHPGETITASHDRAAVSVRVKGRELQQIDAEAGNVSAPGLIDAKDLQVHTRPAQGDGLDVAISLEGTIYTLPDGKKISLDHSQLIATVTAPDQISIQTAEATQGGLKLWGKGNLGLDAGHRPSGRITAATNDFNALLTAIDPYVAINGEQRATLTMVLGLLGKTAKIDIVAKDGQLFVGPMKAGDLRPLY